MTHYNGFHVSELFTYDPNTGIVKHNPDRPVESFRSEKGYKIWRTKCAGKEAGYLNQGYRKGKVKVRGRLYSLGYHRVALWLSGIDIAKGMMVDHIDGNGYNNRLNNLRVVTGHENQKNRKINANNTSGTLGVHWCNFGQKWRSRLAVNGKSVHLGYFEDIEDAIKARKEAGIKYGFHKNHGRDE